MQFILFLRFFYLLLFLLKILNFFMFVGYFRMIFMTLFLSFVLLFSCAAILNWLTFITSWTFRASIAILSLFEFLIYNLRTRRYFCLISTLLFSLSSIRWKIILTLILSLMLNINLFIEFLGFIRYSMNYFLSIYVLLFFLLLVLNIYIYESLLLHILQFKKYFLLG